MRRLQLQLQGGLPLRGSREGSGVMRNAPSRLRAERRSALGSLRRGRDLTRASLAAQNSGDAVSDDAATRRGPQ